MSDDNVAMRELLRRTTNTLEYVLARERGTLQPLSIGPTYNGPVGGGGLTLQISPVYGTSGTRVASWRETEDAEIRSLIETVRVMLNK